MYGGVITGIVACHTYRESGADTPQSKAAFAAGRRDKTACVSSNPDRRSLDCGVKRRFGARIPSPSNDFERAKRYLKKEVLKV